MPETTYGYFPDVAVNIAPQPVKAFRTEVERAINGREQRRADGPPTGQRSWSAVTAPPTGDFTAATKARYALAKFLDDRKGQLEAFLFFSPDPVYVEDAALGSVSAQSSIIIPYKGSTVTDIRVAGVTKAFTVRALTPRSGTIDVPIGSRVQSHVALRINATTQYVDCGSSSNLRATGDQTICAWVNIFAAGAGGNNAICENITANASGVRLSVNASRNVVFRTEQVGANTTGTSTGQITYGAWTHVAAVRAGTTVTFYINGVAAGTATGISNPVTATRSFRLSSDIGAVTALNGLLSEVRYYSEALLAGEILNIYNGNATANANLKGWWRVTEGYGTSVTDWSGYANTGTLTNSPVWVGGEDEITFTGGAQTGAVTGWLIGRPRVTARSMNDAIGQAFYELAADPRAMFTIGILELPL